MSDWEAAWDQGPARPARSLRARGRHALPPRAARHARGPRRLRDHRERVGWKQAEHVRRGRAAVAGGRARPPADARLAWAPPHGQRRKLRRGRRHRRVPRDLARAGPGGESCGPRAVRPPARAAVPHARGDQRGCARRRARAGPPLRPPHDRRRRPSRRLSRGVPGPDPGLGRDAARTSAGRRRGSGTPRRREPASAEPDDRRGGGPRDRARRPRPPARGAARPVAGAAPRGDRGRRRQAPPGRGSRGRRRGGASRAGPGRRCGARPGARAVPGARADRRALPHGASRRGTERRRTRSPSCCPGRRRRRRSTPSTSSSAASGGRRPPPTPSRGGSSGSGSSAPG